MAKASHLKAKVNPPKPPLDLVTPWRPTHSTAGRGGHIAQLKKVAHALEESQRPSGNQPTTGAVMTDPVNLMAPPWTPLPRTWKKKLDGKQQVRQTFQAL